MYTVEGLDKIQFKYVNRASLWSSFVEYDLCNKNILVSDGTFEITKMNIHITESMLNKLKYALKHMKYVIKDRNKFSVIDGTWWRMTIYEKNGAICNYSGITDTRKHYWDKINYEFFNVLHPK